MAAAVSPAFVMSPFCLRPASSKAVTQKALDQFILDRGQEVEKKTLTINCLGLLSPLPRLFSSTNTIESCFSRAGDLCSGVKRWRDGNRAERWAGAVRQKAESRCRHIQEHGQLPRRLNALNKTLDQQQAAV